MVNRGATQEAENLNFTVEISTTDFETEQNYIQYLHETHFGIGSTLFLKLEGWWDASGLRSK